MAEIAYRIEVRASMALADGPDDPDFYTREQAITLDRRRDIEKAVLACLRRFEASDCDVEVMDWRIEDEPNPHGAYCPCSTCGAERARDTAEEPRR